MKTAVIMLVIVIIITALNIYVGNFIDSGTSKMMPYIAKAKAALAEGDTGEAVNHINNLKEIWDDDESMWEAFIDHNDSERVETILMRLIAMADAETPELMLPELQELEFFFTHLNDKQKLLLENIF